MGLMMGGEPTFVSDDDFESPQWRTEALGAEKYHQAVKLLGRLELCFAPRGSLLQYGLGKQYPGEPGPRWALGCYWREDHHPLWHDLSLRAIEGQAYEHNRATAEQFTQILVRQLGVSANGIHWAEDSHTKDWAGYVIPLLPIQVHDQLRWSTCRWDLGDELKSLPLIPSKAQIGLRLPLDAIAIPESLIPEAIVSLNSPPTVTEGTPLEMPTNSIRVALGIETRAGTLRVFVPPLSSARSFVDLISAIEATAQETQIPVLIEGYPPPTHSGMGGFQITPDPGVIEVNIHPVVAWSELVDQTRLIYEEAQQCHLGAEKYTWLGRRVSTGGGAHITIGGQTPDSSPLLRRPDLLRSLMSYWQNHPSLSYLFSGLFVGVTSQAPRLDETRPGTLYELDNAFQVLQPGCDIKPELLDALLGNLLVDITGNTHRTALCIDKLYPVSAPRLQWGLLEFRGFAMPPNAPMRLLQLLLVRALVAWFWQQPYTEPLRGWGTMLEDQFFLPNYLYQDLQKVLTELDQAGYEFKLDWFDPFLEFRFPTIGVAEMSSSSAQPMQLELRHAIEPWPVVSSADSGSSRLVDSSTERIQVTLKGVDPEHPATVVCNHCQVPLMPTNQPGEWVGAVRFRTYQTTTLAHPLLDPHPSLVLEVVDATGRSQGGCTYYTSPPEGQLYEGLPKSSKEAAQRRAVQFRLHGPSSEKISYRTVPIHPDYPHTLDLRRVGATAKVCQQP